MIIENKLIIISVVFSFLFCYYLIRQMLKMPSGTEKMIEIANIIELCAKVYLKRQYITILIVSILLSIFIFIFFDKFYLAGFLIGAVFSSISGYVGMLVSVKANVKTLNAVRTYGIAHALNVAFRSAGITGLLVITLSLCGVFLFFNFLIYMDLDKKTIFNSLLALALGASLISIFARLGGGIFTKAADIGADLVGKLELGIDEDDFRNPATIADNVGDNVGDCAGMAADLYETCCVTNIACMVILSIILNTTNNEIIIFPLTITALSIFSTIIALIFIKFVNNNIMDSLYRSFYITIICSIGFIFMYIYIVLGWGIIGVYIHYTITGAKLFTCSLIGISLTTILIYITEYYTSTSYFPVRSIAAISEKGHAPNIIQGLAISMESPALPVFCIMLSMLLAHNCLGVIGIAIAGSSMVSLSGIIITLDAYGPITDNAGGIASMSKLSDEVRIKTDMLDAVGNTTKAVTKGYAIGSAGLGALVLFITYYEELRYYFKDLVFNFTLENPFVIVGLFLGGIIPYIFASLSMKAVGAVASKVVIEIKNQFSEGKNIDENFKPNYTKVVDLITKESIKKMVLPSILPVILTIVLFTSINLFYNKEAAFVSIGSMLLGIIITGIFLAISMTSGGGAWDNAKKHIENGHFGGKNSIAHKAAITGDMVGDPYKDTAGPAINPLIKASNIIAIFIIIFIHKYHL